MCVMMTAKHSIEWRSSHGTNEEVDAADTIGVRFRELSFASGPTGSLRSNPLCIPANLFLYLKRNGIIHARKVKMQSRLAF